jgi:periplasmic divalent cation tolerance protein
MTAGTSEEAERLATALVEERLAACVNLVAPLNSIYRWRGAVERSEEVLLIAKSRRSLLRRFIERVRALHSYEVPEVIALPIVAGARPYLDWLMAETRQVGRAGRSDAAGPRAARAKGLRRRAGGGTARRARAGERRG